MRELRPKAEGSRNLSSGPGDRPDERRPRCAAGPILLLIALALSPVTLGASGSDSRAEGTAAAKTRAVGPESIPERYESRILRGLDLPLGAAADVGPGSPRERTLTDGVPFEDLPSAELTLDAALPQVGAYDREALVLGGAGDAICVLAAEDFELRSMRSTDGGQSFGAETAVAGGAGAGAVLAVDAALGPDGAVHVALVVASPAGDRGLSYVRSPDRCLSWESPVGLVGDGDPELGITRARIAAGSSGFAAIAFVGEGGGAPYSMATADGGATWTTPSRLDPGNGSQLVATPTIDLDVDDSSDNVYVAYAQDRGSGSQIFTTRSTDGGASFAAEADLDAVTPFRGDSEQPVVQVTDSGAVLVAYWDVSSSSRMFVARSTDQGQTWASAYEENSGSDLARGEPAFAVDTGVSSVQLFWTINDRLWQSRSADDGASFADGQVLDTTADTDPDGWRPATRVAGVRTGTDTWAVAWSDYRNDSYAGTRTDIYVRRSTDDGATWLAAERADTDVAGDAESLLAGLVATESDGFFAAWRDRRATDGREENLHGNRWVSGSGFAAQDLRLDANSRTASAASLAEPFVASDGASGVYVAFTSRGTGHEFDIWVARSGDGGYTFDAPVRVSTTPVGERVQFAPYLAATSDGDVYLAYLADDPVTGQRELRFNRSADFGATWQGADTVLDSFSHPPGYFLNSFDFPNVQLRAVAGGLVYVAWSDNANVFLARSEDGGASITTTDVDQDTRGFNRHPALCAQGDQVVLVVMSPDVAFADFSVWGTVSSDRGASWTSRVQLRSESTFERGIFPALSCDGGSGALAVWADLRNGSTWQLYSNTWDGAAWLGPVRIGGPGGTDHFWPSVARVDGGEILVAYQDFAGAVYAARSSDSGASFLDWSRLDDAAPDPNAVSEFPRAVGDGDDLWVFWQDASAGSPSIAVRWTRDGGVSWSAVRRASREEPGGGFPNRYFNVNAEAAALEDAGLLAWSGGRQEPALDVLLNVADLDDADRDQVGVGADCNDADPGATSVPGPVTGLGVTEIAAAGVRVSWTTQADSAGSGTVYDAVAGALTELRSAGSYQSASCLAAGLAEPFVDDTLSNPLPGEGDYYLVRARNSCGQGSYGESTLTPDPRDDLDASGPCP